MKFIQKNWLQCFHSALSISNKQSITYAGAVGQVTRENEITKTPIKINKRIILISSVFAITGLFLKEWLGHIINRDLEVHCIMLSEGIFPWLYMIVIADSITAAKKVINDYTQRISCCT